MKLFSAIYDRMMVWSMHRRAPSILGALSFAESSFFPVPPDVMLAPMCLSQPQKAWRFATITTVLSVLGGMAGFAIGALAFDAIQPWLSTSSYWPAFQRASAWFDTWGVLAVLLAGFSPIPYKVFTIAAGSLGMPFLPFVLASIVGRGGRFYLVAGLLKWGGPRMEAKLRQYVDRLGWAIVVAVAVGGLAWFFLRTPAAA